ncbi:MAG: serine/threonine-protein kinase [Myxococcaceae bacterium]|nr:serine/threonine-protein kinase [Myxococcaceae bacterium]
MKRPALTFETVDEEVRFLRGLLAVQRLADEVLEDCLERQLGLAAAADVFLTQCARLIHAQAAFVQVKGTHGAVLTRTWGTGVFDVVRWAGVRGAQPVENGRTVFVAPLDLGKLELGSLGFVLPGHFSDGGQQVLALVDAVAEIFDSAVLSFIALSEGHSPTERLDELAAAGDFRPNARIGKYELLTPLGTGGMAQVMVARTVNPGGVSRLVALKRILPKLAEDENIVKQFLDEAKLGMRLSHPNLVTIYDFGQGGGSYFIAMELIAGVDFDHVVYWPNGPLPEALISAVLSQALEGLHAAHDTKGDDGLPLGLVHRDLSPHNLMVGFDGRVKVLDFGVAKMRNARTVTLPGIVKGKPLYMSPEQATAERIDRRSDVFSMGLILHEALTGTRAFDQQDDTKTMESIVNDPLVRPKGIPNPWWAVVEKALQKRPEDRYRNALEMAQAVRDTARPMKDHELGALVSQAFPRRVADMATWEQTKNRLASKRSGPS